MPWSDWEVSDDQIEICKRPDGSDWELGAGAFGKVGCVHHSATISTCPTGRAGAVLHGSQMQSQQCASVWVEVREQGYATPFGSCSLTVQCHESVAVLQVFKALRGGVQVVAVKVLHDAEVGGMNFVREIAILKGCRHTNIVQFQVQPQLLVSALP